MSSKFSSFVLDLLFANFRRACLQVMENLDEEQQLPTLQERFQVSVSDFVQWLMFSCSVSIAMKYFVPI